MSDVQALNVTVIPILIISNSIIATNHNKYLTYYNFLQEKKIKGPG